MKSTKKVTSIGVVSGTLAAVFVCLSYPAPVRAQCTGVLGNTAVYAAGCTTPPTQGSAAYIDASVFTGTSGKTDVCAKINAVLKSSAYPPAGAVIDARGVSATSQVCSISPWGGTAPTGGWRPATILLPSGTIVIPGGWILPHETRIVGENAGPNTGGTGGVTTIQACTTAITGCTTNFSGNMITMGSSVASFNCPSTGCIGVAIEDLWLDGQGLTINGISNSVSQELSYVKHVNLYRIVGTGLVIFGTSQNSGPYTDIGFSLGTATPAAATACAHILSVSTRGIHGLTCTGNISSGTIPSSAVILDGSNNSIEDVEVQGFKNAVLIGANASAQNDVLLNIRGGTNVSTVVGITNNTGKTVSNISIAAVSNGGNNGAVTISDARTTPATSIVSATVALYVLGGQLNANGSTPIGYTRFTTSIGVPSWAVGSTIPSPTTGCVVGSLYSNTGGMSGSMNTLYVCIPKNKCTPSTASCWSPIG